MKLKAAIVAICCALAGPVGATTVLRMEVAELSKEADVVVRGKVASMQSRWTEDKRRIVTEITIEVAEALKGTPGKTVTIVQPGGVVGDIGQKAHGMPEFEKDSEVVVFLEQRGDKVFSVVGLAQGLFKVDRSTDGKGIYVTPAEVDAIVLDPTTRTQVPPRTTSLTLDSLKQTVKATP